MCLKPLALPVSCLSYELAIPSVTLYRWIKQENLKSPQGIVSGHPVWLVQTDVDELGLGGATPSISDRMRCMLKCNPLLRRFYGKSNPCSKACSAWTNCAISGRASLGRSGYAGNCCMSLSSNGSCTVRWGLEPHEPTTRDDPVAFLENCPGQSGCVDIRCPSLTSGKLAVMLLYAQRTLTPPYLENSFSTDAQVHG